MELNADQPGHLAAVLVVIDEHGHHVAINDVDQDIAPRDDLEIVPVVCLDVALQGRIVSERSDDTGLFGFPEVGYQAAPVYKAARSRLAPSLVVEHACILLCRVDIGL